MNSTAAVLIKIYIKVKKARSDLEMYFDCQTLDKRYVIMFFFFSIWPLLKTIDLYLLSLYDSL